MSSVSKLCILCTVIHVCESHMFIKEVSCGFYCCYIHAGARLSVYKILNLTSDLETEHSVLVNCPALAGLQSVIHL